MGGISGRSIPNSSISCANTPSATTKLITLDMHGVKPNPLAFLNKFLLVGNLDGFNGTFPKILPPPMHLLVKKCFEL